MERQTVHSISKSTRLQHSDMERPIARILPAAVNVDHKDNDKSSNDSNFSSSSPEFVASLRVKSCSNTAQLTAEQNTTLAQSTKVSLDLDGIPDDVELLRGRRGPALFLKSELSLPHEQLQSAKHRQSSLVGRCTPSQFPLSSVAGLKSAARDESTTGIIGLPQRSNNNGKPQSSADNQYRLHRRAYEAANASDRKPVERSWSDEDQRRGSSSPEAEAGANCSTTWENQPTSSALRDGELKVPGVEMSRRWGLSLTEQQIQRIELFYSSHATKVFVCRCLASLHSISPPSTGRRTWRLSLCGTGEPSSWKLVDVGVPVLIVDTGHGRRRRRLSVLLADPLTGFTLWRESVDHLADYRRAGNGVHTLRQSTDHARLTAVTFHEHAEADRLMRLMESLTSDPGDTLLNIALPSPSSSSTIPAAVAERLSNGKKRKRKAAATTKASISSPCWFSHVTQLDNAEAASIMHSGAMSPLTAPF